MSWRRIVDASPLICLAKVGHLELLRINAPEVIIPEAVILEIEVKDRDGLVRRAITEATWLAIVTDPVSALDPPEDGLGAGESSVLAMADVGDQVVLDDFAARRYARRHGIIHVGTLGLVIAARHLGIISLARPLIDQLRQVGLYLDDQTVADVLDQVGED